MTKQQDDACWPIASKVERRLAECVLLMDALWGFLQYLLNILFRPTNDSGAECTALEICERLESAGTRKYQSSLTIYPGTEFDHKL